MPKMPRDLPPPLELACLKALWSLGEGNVRVVQQSLEATRPLAYTTVMTVLDRLVRKGKLTRRKVSRSYVYAPAASRDSLRRIALRELLDGFFDGSEEELLLFLRGQENPRAMAVPAGSEGRIDTVLL
jgi:predicted transcriptional regulator